MDRRSWGWGVVPGLLGPRRCTPEGEGFPIDGDQTRHRKKRVDKRVFRNRFEPKEIKSGRCRPVGPLTSFVPLKSQ